MANAMMLFDEKDRMLIPESEYDNGKHQLPIAFTNLIAGDVVHVGVTAFTPVASKPDVSRSGVHIHGLVLRDVAQGEGAVIVSSNITEKNKIIVYRK